MPTELRHTSIQLGDQHVAEEQLGENARDTNAALSECLRGSKIDVLGYAAVGSSATRLKLAARATLPGGLLLSRCVKTQDAGTAVVATQCLQFYVEDGLLTTFEPDGLTADTLYDLTFYVLE